MRSHCISRNHICSPANIHFQRLLIQVLVQRPEIFSGLSRRPAGRIRDTLAQVLSTFHDDGIIQLNDPAIQSTAFLGAIMGYPLPGVRHDADRLTTNIGLGHRYMYKNWLFGYNAFYDTTWNNKNAKWGAGIEAWRDYLKFSGNLYRRISGWRESSQHQDYLERPANGWDIRAEGWLPFLPQLGARLVYEHYYGDNVATGRFNERHSVAPVDAKGESRVNFTADKPGIHYIYSTIHYNTHRLPINVSP